MTRKKRRGLLKLLALSIVITRGKTHGYNIYKELDELGMEHWKPSIGTLYRLLSEMVSEGYIEKEESMYGNRRIIYYKPTDKGIEEFQKIASTILCKMIVGLKTLLPAIESLKKRGYIEENIEDKLKRINTILNEYFKAK